MSEFPSTASAAPLSVTAARPSHATIPTAKSRRMRRAEAAALHAQAPHDPLQTPHAPPTSAVLYQVKQKQRKNKQRHHRSNSRQAQVPPHAQSESHIPSHPPSSEVDLPLGSMLADYMNRLFQGWKSSADTESSASHSSSLPLSSEYAYVRRRAGSASAEDHTSSFDSGNETDREAEIDATEYALRAAHLAQAAEDTDDEEPMVMSTRGGSRGSLQHLVPCEYSAFGCETLVQSPAGSGTIDPHYQSAYAHHLSLLHAKHAIVSSQKSQLALLLEQEYRARDKAQRRLEKRDRRYAKLRAAYEHKRQALQQVTQVRDIQDLVGAFLADDPQVDAALQVRALTEQLAAARAELAEKDRLLVEAADYLKLEAKKQDLYRQQQDLLSHGSTSVSLPVAVTTPTAIKPPTQKQQKKKRAKSPAPAQTQTPPLPPQTAEPEPEPQQPQQQQQPDSETAPQTTSPPLQLQSPLHSIQTVPVAVATPFVSASYKAKPTHFPKQTALQTAHLAAQAQAAAALTVAAAHAQAQRDTVVYYSVPHSALKPLAPFLNNAMLSAVFASAATHPQPHLPHGHSEETTEPGGQSLSAQSRGAKMGLTKFCPQVWLKRAGLYNQEGK